MNYFFVFVFQQLERAAAVTNQFFDLPPSSKQRYAWDNIHYHGWVPSGDEV